jgi:hypothetical protein
MRKIEKNSTLYENCVVLSPEGIEMFRCNKKKIQWYLKKGLADLVQDQQFLTIKLRFQPKGDGWKNDKFYLQTLINKCVVCGCDNDLTKHHVVPHTYRKHFKENYKNSNHYDVLPVCRKCHSKYEKFADEKKKDIEKQFQAPRVDINSYRNPEYSYAYTLLKHGTKMPNTKKQEMLSYICKKINKKPEELKTTELENLAALSPSKKLKDNPNSKSHGQYVIEQLRSEEDIQQFTVGWRMHFVECMKPKHLPENWEIHKNVYKPH